MKRPRTLRLELVMLLAMVLPLQGFAAVWSCAAPSAADSALHHCDHAGHPAGNALHHGCGTCCSAAVAVNPRAWAAPRAASPNLSLPSSWSLPALALDRLDRPPRFIPA